MEICPASNITMEKNPFDLKGRDGGPERTHAARNWTPEEQAEKLTGYLEIPPEFWDQIRYGTHVRYMTKANEFRSGGFVLKNPYDTKPQGAAAEKRFIKLQNGFNDKAKSYAQWIAAYEDVARIWIKPDAGVLVMMQTLENAVRGLNENIRKIAEHSKKLETRIGQLEGKR
jgi:hypothetical protein